MKATYLTLLMVFGIVAAPFLGSLHVDDYVRPGEELVIYTNVVNSFNQRFEDVQLRVDFLDFGDRVAAAEQDLNDYEVRGRRIMYTIPRSADPGYYWMKISVSNDDEVKDWQWMQFRVI